MAKAVESAKGGVLGITVKTVYAYNAQNPDEVSFPVGAIITQVETRDGGWWTGRYGERTGLIPSNYVKEIDSTELKKREEEKKEKSGNPLGDLTQSSLPVMGLMMEE